MLNSFRIMRPNCAPLNAMRMPAVKGHTPVQLTVARAPVFGCQTAATAHNTQNGPILVRRRSTCGMRPGAVPRSTPENQHAGGAVARTDRTRPEFGCGWQLGPGDATPARLQRLGLPLAHHRHPNSGGGTQAQPARPPFMCRCQGWAGRLFQGTKRQVDVTKKNSKGGRKQKGGGSNAVFSSEEKHDP